MALSNNINPLPWYGSPDHQNHKRNFNNSGVFGLITPVGYILPFQILCDSHVLFENVDQIKMRDIDGNIVPGFEDITALWKTEGLTLVAKDGYNIIKNNGQYKLNIPNTPQGQFYLEMHIMWEEPPEEPGGDHPGEDYFLYSEVFTFNSSMAKYLKLEWWDNQDFMLNNQYAIDYTYYSNWLYLDTQIGKPNYTFEEEATKRDGYTFVEKQISEKVFRFDFIAPEYMCDTIRLVRMHDNVRIRNIDGVVYTAEGFLPTVKWQDVGDIASVEVEIQCDTVIKKINKLFTPSQYGGDYNNDYNNDYTNGSI